MSALFCDPHDPLKHIADVEGVLTLLTEITHVDLSPVAEHGRLFLLKTYIDSVLALAMRLSDPDAHGGGL